MWASTKPSHAQAINSLRRKDLLDAAVRVDLHVTSAGSRRMDREVQAAAFGALDDQVDLAVVGRRTEGLRRTAHRGGHRVRVESTEIGEHVHGTRRGIRSPTGPLAVAVHEVLLDMAIGGRNTFEHCVSR